MSNEIINEPLWNQVKFGESTYEQVFNYHNTVATKVKKLNSDVLIGGYVAAFPDFEKNNFQDWENIDKLFMDMCGEKMDFWSIHLYDFSSIGGGKKKLRSGSNIEATFDMMEHYSMLLLDTVKPFLISEYGGRAHDLESQPWSSYRDWMCIKGTNAQLMSFLERPNLMLSTLPFIMLKTKWHGQLPGNTHEHRLYRMEGEPASATGKWVYTDFVKFYQLWVDVKGSRIDTCSSNLDIQVNAYAHNNKVYVIVNNLLFDEQQIKLNLFENNSNSVEEITVKHLYEKYNQTKLDTTVNTNVNDIITLGYEATMVVEYTFENNLIINHSNNEVKYYADTYYKSIVAGNTESFNINDVRTGNYGEAILRLGIGREHDKSLQPQVKVNGTEISVPANFRGYDQKERDSFYDVIEIPIAIWLLQENNTIDVSFSDNGGHIASVAMQVFNFSKEIVRANERETSAICAPSIFRQVELSPNPITAFLNIKIPGLTGSALVKVNGLDGKEFLRHKLSGSKTRLNMQSLPKGMYTVSISNQSSQHLLKVIKQ